MGRSRQDDRDSGLSAVRELAAEYVKEGAISSAPGGSWPPPPPGAGAPPFPPSSPWSVPMTRRQTMGDLPVVPYQPMLPSRPAPAPPAPRWGMRLGVIIFAAASVGFAARLYLPALLGGAGAKLTAIGDRLGLAEAPPVSAAAVARAGGEAHRPQIVPLSSPAAPEARRTARPADRAGEDEARGSRTRRSATRPARGLDEEAAPPAVAAATPGPAAPRAATAPEAAERPAPPDEPADPFAEGGAAAAPAEETRPATKGGESLDDLLTAALGKDKGPAEKKGAAAEEKVEEAAEEEPPPAKAEPPKALSSSEIRSAMRPIEDEARACGADGLSGPADLKITLSPEGEVTNVVVSGKLAGTAAAACVAKAVRGAQFPASAGLKFDYRVVVR